MTISTAISVPSDSTAPVTRVIAGQARQTDAFADVDAVRGVQSAEEVRGFAAGDPLQDALGHFDQRDLQPQFRGHGGGLEPDVPAPDDQHPRAVAAGGGHGVDIGQRAHHVDAATSAPPMAAGRRRGVEPVVRARSS